MSVHAPKRAWVDLDTMINHDTKGQEFPLDAVEVTSFGLFFARPVFAHDRLAYQQSWLLPDFGLRISDFTPHPHLPREHDHYVDIADIHTPSKHEPMVWGWTDHYLDLVIRTGHGVDVLDSDEFTQAIAAGQLDVGAAERAFDHAVRALAGAVAHNHSVTAWLHSLDVPLTWTTPPDPAGADLVAPG